MSGNLTLDPTLHARLKKKIRKHISEIKRLFLIPKNSRDIKKKRKILQQKKTVSILTSLASEATPIINKLVTENS